MGKRVKEVMSSEPCAIDAEKPVSYAAKMMRDENVGMAPVVEGDRLVGALTDRDIVTRVVAAGKDPGSVTAREAASTQLVTAEPEQDLDEALKMMASKQVRRLPVVENGRLVGVPAQADVALQAKDKKTGDVVEQISQP
jgi:CBS domain-containing protein